MKRFTFFLSLSQSLALSLSFPFSVGLYVSAVLKHLSLVPELLFHADSAHNLHYTRSFFFALSVPTNDFRSNEQQ